MRPNLARVRASGANIIIVDVDKNLIKPFLYQVGFLFTHEGNGCDSCVMLDFFDEYIVLRLVDVGIELIIELLGLDPK